MSLCLRPSLSWLVPLIALVGCGSSSDSSPSEPTVNAASNVFDGPVAGLSRTELAKFNDGDLAFSTPLREADGLGPLYTRVSCDACHASGVRGPGVVQKMALVEDDGVTPAGDQSALAWGHTVHPLTVAGAVTPIEVPALPNVKVSVRVGPPVLGRGYMEAIDDAEIERMEREQAARTDGVHGRVNRVIYGSEPSDDPSFNPHQRGDQVIGRFGVKARIATLDEFTADAFQGDMGITSPLRPHEFKNPDGLEDDAKPGVDVDYESVDSRAMYLRLLAIPERRANELGERAFARATCDSCHTLALRTRADYPVAALAGVDAPIYSDMLLHRMGSELADGMPSGADDGSAGSFEWRTAPLIGLRFNRTYLHDGRAKSIEEAIVQHRGAGSEANASLDLFDALSASEKSALIDFVSAL